MYQSLPLLTLPAESQTAIRQVTQAFRENELGILFSFDLQVARAAHQYCGCPHHGTEQCDCQLVVLLVYGQDHQPVTVVAHSSDGETRFELVDSSQQPADLHLSLQIRSILSQLKNFLFDPGFEKNPEKYLKGQPGESQHHP